MNCIRTATNRGWNHSQRSIASSSNPRLFPHPSQPLDPSSLHSSPPHLTPSPSAPAHPPLSPSIPAPVDSTTHFGFKNVPESLKEALGSSSFLFLSLSLLLSLWSQSDPVSPSVKGVFSSVASSYDVMNDAMSLGIHRLWKDHYVKKVRPSFSSSELRFSPYLTVFLQMNPHGGMNCLDVAGGTGDIAIRLLDHARTVHADRCTAVKVLDINPEMLAEGQKRFAKTMYHATPQVSFMLGNAEDLAEIESDSIDLYTIAFGIRNCTHVDRVLKEAFRVLKKGGVFSCLEFSKVTNPLLEK